MPAEKLDIVIPVYNEGAAIYKVYEHLKIALNDQFIWRVFFVYDFAEDSTVPFLKELCSKDTRVVPIQQDLGKGVVNALKYAFKKVHDDAVVVAMGDDSDDLETIPYMYNKFREGAVVVASSRYSKGGQYQGGSFIKKYLSKMAGWILYQLGVGTKDPTNNFKLYSGKFLKTIAIESSGGFEIALELTVKAAASNLKVDEVSGVWKDREVGNSNFKMIKWLPHYLHWFFYYIWKKIYH